MIVIVVMVVASVVVIVVVIAAVAYVMLRLSSSSFIRVGFWQNGYFADFLRGPPDLFADFVAGLVLLIFVGKNAQKNPP